MEKKYTEIATNPGKVKLSEIPVLEYPVFMSVIDDLLPEPANHCIAYYAMEEQDHYTLLCCIGCDEEHTVKIFSHHLPLTRNVELRSLTSRHFPLHIFEREIHENSGIPFTGHPWLKPVRFPHENEMDCYPFYAMESEELHEVGVGPIHAGIIEPGYFRFICNGEKVLHLETRLGYQHRGVEPMFVKKTSLLQQAVLAESICGDTTVGHSLCHAGLMETLAGVVPTERRLLERSVALELERIAIHIGDTAALCTDIAYQFGQVVNEALRTIVINTLQAWCGNRFGKGLVRCGGTHYPLTTDLAAMIRANLEDVLERYRQITARIFTMPSVLNRFEGTGRIGFEQASLIGAVGMAARSSGLKRDIRWSHPFVTAEEPFNPVILTGGDVWSRAMMRKLEVEQSGSLVMRMLEQISDEAEPVPPRGVSLQSLSFAISLTEGWRGEICHIALTDDAGKIMHYKVKDPSFHNWMALELAVRGQEISDFPLCNKSFNLSYCGNDL